MQIEKDFNLFQNTMKQFLNEIGTSAEKETSNLILNLFEDPESFQDKSREAALILSEFGDSFSKSQIYHNFKGEIINPQNKIIVSGNSQVKIVLMENRIHEIILMNEATAHIDGKEFAIAEILLMHDVKAYIESSNYCRIFVKTLDVSRIKTLTSTVNGEGDIVVRNSKVSISIKEIGNKKQVP